MHLMRESWTDDRLDSLNEKVDFKFENVDQRFDRVEVELHDLRAETKAEFVKVRAEMKEEFAAVRTEMKDESRAMRAEIAVLRSDVMGGIGTLQRMMVQFSGVMVAAAIGLVATQL